MGMERFVALFEACGGQAPAQDADIFLVAVGEAALQRAVILAEELRDRLAGIRVELNLGGGSFRSQLKRADKSNAQYALVIGEQELADGTIGLKPLRSTEDQLSLSMDTVVAELAARLEDEQTIRH
jgi:histidyl-tRNA synthetase